MLLCDLTKFFCNIVRNSVGHGAMVQDVFTQENMYGIFAPKDPALFFLLLLEVIATELGLEFLDSACSINE